MGNFLRLFIVGPNSLRPWPIYLLGPTTRAEKGYNPGSVIQVQNSLGTQPRTIQSSACPRSHKEEGQKQYRNSLGKNLKYLCNRKGYAGKYNDQGKLLLLPFNTLHLTEPYSPAFTTTPNHSGYGLMGQVSILECRSYTWMKDKEHKLV